MSCLSRWETCRLAVSFIRRGPHGARSSLHPGYDEHPSMPLVLPELEVPITHPMPASAPRRSTQKPQP